VVAAGGAPLVQAAEVEDQLSLEDQRKEAGDLAAH